MEKITFTLEALKEYDLLSLADVGVGYMFIILGLIISKEFRGGLITMIASVIVFTPVILIGILYSIPYSIYMPFKEKNWKLFFKIWWKALDGTYAFLGDLLRGTAVRYDELGNVWGEWFEDAVAVEENTTFGDKSITISASIGYLQFHNIYMYKTGHVLSKLLNKVFRQERHTLGSYEKHIALKELKEKNLLDNI